MKKQILAIMALAALVSCSKKDIVPDALNLWNSNETIMDYRSSSQPTDYAPNEFAYVDLDKDGTPELLLREHEVSEYGGGTGFIGVYTNGKSGLKLVALASKMEQIGDIFICKNGMVVVSDGNESGTQSSLVTYVLKNSELATVYYDEYFAEEEEYGDVDFEEEEEYEEDDDVEYEDMESDFTEIFYKSEPANAERVEISDEEYDKATAGNTDYSEIDSFDWKKIQ